MVTSKTNCGWSEDSRDAEHEVVGFAVGDEAAQRVGAVEGRYVVEGVEAQLGVHPVAPPVRGVGGMRGAGGVAERGKVRGQVVVAVQVVEHVGVHVGAEMPHARSREELELAVAGARPEGRGVGGAPGERVVPSGDLAKARRLRVGPRKALEAREVGERLVHDGHHAGQGACAPARVCDRVCRGGPDVGRRVFGAGHGVFCTARAFGACVPVRAHVRRGHAFARVPDARRRFRLGQQLRGRLGRIALRRAGDQFLHALEEAQHRALLGVGAARVPFAHHAVEVLPDVAHVHPRARRHGERRGHAEVRRRCPPRKRGLGHEVQAHARERVQREAGEDARVGQERVPAAHGRRRGKREQVCRHHGLPLVGDDEVVRHANEQACRQKKRPARARALPGEVDEGEQHGEHAQVDGHVVGVHGKQSVVGGKLHEEEAQRHGQDGHGKARGRGETVRARPGGKRGPRAAWRRPLMRVRCRVWSCECLVMQAPVAGARCSGWRRRRPCARRAPSYHAWRRGACGGSGARRTKPGETRPLGAKNLRKEVHIGGGYSKIGQLRDAARGARAASRNCWQERCETQGGET